MRTALGIISCIRFVWKRTPEELVKGNQKPVHYQESQGALENLPFPIVLYPRFYGTFFAFKENAEANPTLCSCTLEAIENYVRYKIGRSDNPYYSNPSRRFVIDSSNFPKELIEHLMAQNAPGDLGVIDFLDFESDLCHQCNQAVPSYRYCHEMYGTVFVQTYGWYINKRFWEYGIDPVTYMYLDEICPPEVKELYGKEYVTLLEQRARCLEAGDYRSANEAASRIGRIGAKVRHVVEDEVRVAFGHKKIGEGWTSETVLYYIIRRLYPATNIRRHYRPEWLKGLELDVFIEDLKMGLEYQGIQHFKAVKHWGGQKGLQITKLRDKKKKELCEKHGIRLVYFNYYDDLSEEFVKKRLLFADSD